MFWEAVPTIPSKLHCLSTGVFPEQSERGKWSGGCREPFDCEALKM
jgi:hypothetical protein